MPSDLLKKRFNELERLALAAGLRPYDVHFFEVPASVIYQVSSYGLPTRYAHWSFGKCVTGDTYVFTEDGMSLVSDVFSESHLNFSKDKFVKKRIEIYDDAGPTYTSHFYKNEAECLSVETQSGISITGTHKHPLLVLCNGKIEWRRISDIDIGDEILLRVGSNSFGNKTSTDFNFKPNTVHYERHYKNIQIPKIIDPDLSFLCGVLTAEGMLAQDYYLDISVGREEADFIESITRKFKSVFGLTNSVVLNNGGCTLKYRGKMLLDFLRQLGFDKSLAPFKKVPSAILATTKENICAYIKGVFEGDGNVNSNSIEIGLSSKELIRQLQLMLLNLGIISTTRYDIRVKPAGVVRKESTKHRLWITSAKNISLFYDLVGFESTQKKQKLQICLSQRKIRKYDTRVYRKARAYIKSLYPGSIHARNSDQKLKFAFQNALYYSPTGDSISYILEHYKEDAFLRQLLNYACTQVVSVEPVGKHEVFDFTIPSRTNRKSPGHRFLSNGMISHNSYQHQKNQGEMGFSKIYEMIINNDPSYAFLDSSNTDTTNLLICAHCLGHSDFFANNIMFKLAGETNMIQVAKRHANLIDEFRKDYGDDEVDQWLDIALALERHIDVYKTRKREKYPQRHIEYQERTPTKWEDILPDDEKKPLIKKVMKNVYLPPYPEKDLLWFLSEYSHLEDWQKRIFEIVRRESYYFFPQYKTKILNEGWASYWHAELMAQYAQGNDNDFGVTDIEHPLTAEEHLDFAQNHEKVVQPGLKIPLKVEVPELDQHQKPTGRMIKQWNPKIVQNPRLFSLATRINPYYIGFKILRDIKKRWDKYHEDGYMKNEYDEEVEVTIDGSQKLREVMKSEDDQSFLRKYLTEELVEDLHLFGYGSPDEYADSYGIQEEIQKRVKSNGEDHLGQMPIDQQIIHNRTVKVRTKDVKKIVNMFAKNNNNYGVPIIVIRRVDSDGLLRMEHLSSDSVNLDIQYAAQVLRYVARVWGRPVEMIRKDKEKSRTWIMKCTGDDIEIDHEVYDYPEVSESKEIMSSW